MKVQELKAFIAVCKYGSFTMAAEKIYMTQPTISWLIQSLEKELGKPLIVRSKGVRQVSLTKAGQIFYPQAERFLQLWSETEQLLTLENTDTFRFGCTPSMSAILLPSVHQRFLQLAPQCDLGLTTSKSLELFDAVERGNLDAALVCKVQPSSHISILPFASEPQVFICRKNARYPDHVHLEDLNLANQVVFQATDEGMSWQKHHFSKHGRPLAEIEAAYSIKEFFLTRDAWAVVPLTRLYGIEDEFRVCELDDLPANRLFYLISKYPPKNPYYNNLRKTLHYVLRGIDGMQMLAEEM